MQGLPKRTSKPSLFSWSIPAQFIPGTPPLGGISVENDTTVRIQLASPLTFTDRSCMHMCSVEIPYSIPNVGDRFDAVPSYPLGNNRISITWPGINGGARTDYYFPKGLYDLTGIAEALNRILYGMGLLAIPEIQCITMGSIDASQQAIFIINPTLLLTGSIPAGVVFDFINPAANGALGDSIGPLLGWTTLSSISIPGGTTTFSSTAPNEGNMNVYSQIIFYITPVVDSYLQGSSNKGFAYLNLASSTPNTMVSFSPSMPQPVSLAAGQYSSFLFYMSDEFGNPIYLKHLLGSTSVTVIFYQWKDDGTL